MHNLADNLAELLITHHIGGRWRAPLSQRMRDVPGPQGLLGRLVEADAADLARALAAARATTLPALSPTARADLAQRFAAELAARAEVMAEARRLEGLPADSSAGTPTLPALPPAPTGTPLALLGSRPALPSLLAGILAQALRAGHPVILKPAPRAPLSPMILAEALAAAGAPPGSLALLQGGGSTTGAALLALPLGAALLAGKPPRPGLPPVHSLR